MSLREFTIILVSNASTATFADTLADFTTLLPEQLNLTGFWEVALAEIAWPAAIQNITSGHFKYRVAPENNDISGSSSTDSRKRKLNERPYGMVTMCELPLRPVQKAIIEKVGSIKPGVYLSVDQILRSICKKIFGGHVDNKFPLSWRLDAASEALKLYYEGSEQECIFLETISKDLQNVLGMKTLIDCSEKGKTNKQANNSVLSKTIGQFPIDLTGGCNTILYIAIWCKMKFWETVELHCCEPFH